MEPAAEFAADVLGLGQSSLILATDRKDHPLAAFDLVWRRDAEPVVGRSQGGQNLDGEVSLGRIVEEGDDPELALRALDGTGPNLRHFHGALYFFPKSRCCGLDGCICVSDALASTKFDAPAADFARRPVRSHAPECEPSVTGTRKVVKCEAGLLRSSARAFAGESPAHAYSCRPGDHDRAARRPSLPTRASGEARHAAHFLKLRESSRAGATPAFSGFIMIQGIPPRSSPSGGTARSSGSFDWAFRMSIGKTSRPMIRATFTWETSATTEACWRFAPFTASTNRIRREPAGPPLRPMLSVFYGFSIADRFDAEGLIFQASTGSAVIVAKRFDSREAELFAIPLHPPAPLLRPALPRRVGFLPGFVEPATGASLSADGQLLAVCSSAVTRVYRRDHGSGWNLLAEVRHESLPIEGITWDGEDLILVSEGRGIDRIAEATWRRSARRRRQTLRGPAGTEPR